MFLNELQFSYLPMEKFQHQVKKHFHYHIHFFPHYLLISVATAVICFGLYSLLPADIHADSQVLYPLNKSVGASISGFIDNKSLQINSNYDTPMIAKVESNLPFKNLVTLVPTDLLYPNTTYRITIYVKNWLGVKTEKHISFKTESLPIVALASKIPEGGKFPTNTALEFSLTGSLSSDKYLFRSTPTFQFSQEKVGNKLIIKPKTKLIQGQNYALTISPASKVLKNEILFQGSVSILDPLLIGSSNPNNGQTLVPKQIIPEIHFSKPVVQTSLLSALKIEPLLNYTPIWKDSTTLQLSPSTPLKTATSYSLTFGDSLTGSDGSQLPDTQIISFTTAGKVVVRSFSPTGKYFGTNQNITVNFDQPVDQASAQSKFNLSPSTEGTFSWNGNSLIFKPKTLSLLTTYTVTLLSGVKSVGGDDSTQIFSANFVTTGERTRTIGYSVKKRPITATYFGTGSKKILLIGTMHGSESNTGNMLNSWISYLRSNQGQIGNDRTFIILPFVNPDGRAANNRFNANGVDLNRNFDLPDWQALTYWQTRSYPTGGGSSPFSEPESRSLRDLVYTESPVASISYHANANLVLGDGSASSFGNWYANLTGYTRSQSSGEETDISALGYPITGTYEEWATKRGVNTLVIEFISRTANEYSRNLPALKGLLTYPF